MATKKFRCKVCGYIHEGETAPATCPTCKAPASEFVEEGAAKKKGLNTNGNGYTVMYASVMVIIVAFLLAFISQTLKPIQDVNVAVDKKKQILAALNIRSLSNADTEAEYAKVVKADQVIDQSGNVTLEEGAFKMGSKETNENSLPLYVCEVNGETKYVIPVYGKGLWGAIWGYVSLDADKDGVYGAFFSHESETAGLGSIITEYAKFQKQFEGKKLFNPSTGEIALSVAKIGKNVPGVETENRCDGITGATITSDGVNAMLHDSFARYKSFLTKK